MCIVGSGAGGDVMAGELASRGLKVVVLEAGGYYDDQDFLQLEIPAYQHTYWRGGPTPTADLKFSIQAGSCLGGGTTINWTNSLRTKPWVREEWEREHGLEGVAGADVDRHLDAVWQRLSVTDRASDLNGPQQRMKQGADALGWSFKTVTRNTDRERYSPDTAGYIGFGDQTGSKRSTVKTYLQDAVDHGADVVVRCWAERILTENGRAAGVEAVWSDPTHPHPPRSAPPHRPRAAGGRRGGRARVAGAAAALPDRRPRRRPPPAPAPLHRDVRHVPRGHKAWWGAPHAALVDEHVDLDGDGYGFLIEGAQYTTAIAGSAVPFTTAREHKELMSRFKHGGTFIALLREKGSGRVTIDRVTIDHAGMGVPSYALTHPDGVRHAHAGIAAQARLHAAAGAQQVVGLAAGVPTWRWGDDLEAYIARLQRIRCAPAAGGCSQPTRWAPAGWARTRRGASPARTASCTARRASGSATAAPSRRLRARTR